MPDPEFVTLMQSPSEFAADKEANDAELRE
jgi:hypothetical protein